VTLLGRTNSLEFSTVKVDAGVSMFAGGTVVLVSYCASAKEDKNKKLAAANVVISDFIVPSSCCC
jgi:hypothetical protein